MQEFEKIKKYCNDVCEQIRWEKAKPVIAVEIENHLCDQRDAYISNGDDEVLATEKAITQMGDAIFVGQELDKSYKPKSQWLMIILTGIFMLIGLSINYFIDNSVNSLNTFSILPYVLSFMLLIICYYIDFTELGKNAKEVYFLVLTISLLTVMFGRRIVRYIGKFSLELSYLSLLFPLAFALLVYSMRNKGNRGILMSGICYLPFAVILLYVPTISGFGLYTITALVVLSFAISRGWFGKNKKQGLLLVLIPTAVAFFSTVIFILVKAPHRLAILFNPYNDRLGAGYIHALIRDILSGSILFGKGTVPQNIITALPFIGEDYFLVYLIHQFGFIVLFCITAFILMFFAVGIYRTLKLKSMLGSLVSLSIILTFILQCVFYIGDTLGYGIFSSYSLPFISYGKSAFFINSILIGFMLSIFRTGEIFRDRSVATIEKRVDQNHSLFSYDNGKIIINLKRNLY